MSTAKNTQEVWQDRGELNEILVTDELLKIGDDRRADGISCSPVPFFLFLPRKY